ncbi:MAG: c-type cytochrome domain-containing protein [Opitutaceae bacterium]
MKRLLTLCTTTLLGATLAASAAEKIDFGKDIYPILKESCLSCHAAPYVDTRDKTKEPKGGLRLDTPEWIQKGYLDKEGVQHSVITPGDADASEFYTLTILPEDHDDIMPGKGDPLTKVQTELLKQWINEGADYGNFKAPAYVNPKSKQAAETK